MFSVIDEYETFFRERIEFLTVELTHIDIMGKTGGKNDLFNSNLLLRKNILSDIIKETEAMKDRVFAGIPFGWEEAKLLNSIEVLFDLLPVYLADTTQAYLNRKGREYISRYAPQKLPGPVVSLSSVHPTYPASIAAIECLSNSIHTKLKPLYGDNFFHGHPLFTLWEASEYYTSVIKIEDIEPICDDVTCVNVYGHKIKVADLLHLFSFGLPRWACHHIRVAGAILAHEHFHHIVYLVKLCLKYREQCLDTEPELEERFDSIILQMSTAFIEKLYPLLSDFLTHERTLHFWRIYEIVEEFLCDAVGCLLVGPAFAYATILQLFPSTVLDEHYLEMTHPLSHIRISLQADLLRYLNMPLAASKVEDMSKPIRDFMNSSEYRQHVGDFADHFESWLAREETQSFFHNFCLLLSQAIDSDKEIDESIGFKSYHFEHPREEIIWQESLERLIEEISANNVYFGIDNKRYSPTDILNAFWLAKEQEYVNSKKKSTVQPFQVSWRFWLSKYLDKYF